MLPCAPISGLIPLAVRLGPLDIAQPWWLLALVALVPVVWLWWTSRVPGSPLRRRVSLALRVAIILALVLALAGTRMVRTNRGICVVFVVDQSKSVTGLREVARAQMQQAVEAMGKDDEFVIVEFGRDAVLESLPSPKGPLPTPAQVSDADHTDIARALRLALASFPSDRQKRIVLFSDGNQNLGDAVREARIAAAGEVDVNVMPLGALVPHEVMIEQITAPGRVQKDAPLNIRVVISATDAQPVDLIVTRDGQAMPRIRKQLQAGSANVVEIPDRLSQGGFHNYEVTVLPLQPGLDTFPDNNTARVVTRVDAPGKVLVIQGRPSDEDFIGRALQGEGVELERRGPDGLPPNVAGYSAYDCVVLENVSALPLSQWQMDALARWVKDFGGGVVMVGGDQSFGRGNWWQTPLADISPVDMEVKREKHLASIALVIVLDKSGSMGAPASGGTKMDLANNGSVKAITMLSEADEGLIGAVDTECKWMSNSPRLLALTEANKAYLKRYTLQNQAGGGGIYCLTALDHAYRAVTHPSVQAQSRHVILFADAADSEQTEGTIELIRKYRHGNPPVTLTVIGLGTAHDSDAAWQQQAAKEGGGRWYVTDDAMKLPTIFTKETFLISRSPFVEKKEGIAVHPYFESPLWRGISSIPKVYGYIGTTLKPPTADRPGAILAAHGLEKDDPLLAHWECGLGKVVAYTSDANKRWGKDWIGWEAFAQFWSQTVRWTGKVVQNSDFTTTLAIEGNEGSITVEAAEGASGKPRNNLLLETQVEGPDPNAPPMTVKLLQVGPGRYQGKFAANQNGVYLGSVHDARTGQAVDTSGAVSSYPAEFRDLAPNTGLLKTLAQITGGAERPEMKGIFKPKDQIVETLWPLWELLMLVLALGLLGDVAWRRLNIADWFRRGPLPALSMATMAASARGQSAVGAFKAVKSGRKQMHEQSESLRQRLAAAADRGVGSDAGVPAEVRAALGEDVTGSTDLPPAAQVQPTATAPDYAHRLLGAKKRAADAMREKEKEG